MPKTVMVVSTTGYHWEEVFGAYREFKNAGWTIDFFTVDGKPPKPDPVSLKLTGPFSLFGFGIARSISPQTPLGQEIEQKLQQARALSEIQLQGVDVLYLPGGHGCLFDMNSNKNLHQIIGKLYAQNIILSGVCHATSTFAFTKEQDRSIVDGKKLTGFPDILDCILVAIGAVDKRFLPIPLSNEKELRKAGAKSSWVQRLFALGNPTHTVVDKPFVTGVGPKAAKRVAQKVIHLFSR